MTSTHIYFCSNQNCKMEVSIYGTECRDCSDGVSTEPSECPGCGEDILIGANGYCAECWGDRFDSIELSYCMGCGERSPFIENQHCRDCNDKRVEASQVIKTWWMRLRSERYDEYEGISCRCVGFGPLCGHCLDMLDEAPKPHWCGKPDCEQCQSEYYEQCGGCGTNCNLWDDRYCKSCYDVRYVAKCTKGCGPTAPGSKRCYECIDGPEPEPDFRTMDDVRDELEVIMAKLRFPGMTIAQEADWERLRVNRQVLLQQMELCPGCRDGALNQQGHMVQGGCLDEPERIPWEDYDQDDLRKMDLQSRR